ncbi:MAG: hypothetical protein GXO40_05740 [Epsilonproteobacteria bacterium]|nr:hypothetical protein [Campylobacterota bacterium]
MKLLLFSTKRKIRNWLSQFHDTILPKHYTIGEFFEKIITVRNKKFIDQDLRKIYLFKAIEQIDIEKLGFKKEFLSFFSDSEFIFGFLREIFLEGVSIDTIVTADTYTEYQEHLSIIKQIKHNYQTLLLQDGYTDVFLIDDYKINTGILQNIEEIEIYLDGYLPKFEREILKQISIPISIYTNVTKFNQTLIAKMFQTLQVGYCYKIDPHSNTAYQLYKLPTNTNIQVSSFSKRLTQINFVFAKIAEFVAQGIEAQNIAVILPDERFSEFLADWDVYSNLNFAMGESFTHSNIYITLKALYEYLINNDEISYQKIASVLSQYNNSSLLDFIQTHITDKEKQVIQEDLFVLRRFETLLSKEEFLFLILNRWKQLSFDDVYSGKVTVMGLLESRGMAYEGVIIVDFNDSYIPNVNSKDLFLNTAIRHKSNLPTQADKENLQKHYYYTLINNAKQVAISYELSSDANPSKFLYELGKTGQNHDEKYKEVIYQYDTPPQITKYEETFDIKFPLTPTSLKTLLECPKKYYLSKVLNITDEDNKIHFGNVFHQAMEKIVKNKESLSSSEDYFGTLMDLIYQKLNTKKEILEIRVMYEEGIRKFTQSDFYNLKNATHITEEWLSINDKYVAKVDRVDFIDNKIILIDYKSADVEHIIKHPYEFQLEFYYLWAQKQYPQKEIITGYWDIKAGEFIRVVPQPQRLYDVVLPTQVKEAEDIVVDEKVFQKAENTCKWCEYKIGCKER